MSDMTNAEIAAEFETLFGTGEESEEEETTTEEAEETAETQETEETETTEEETEETEESEEATEEETADETVDTKPEASAKDSETARRNYAFAEQRLQIKKNDEFIRSIGKLIGFDEHAKIEEIQDKVKEVLLEKEAKENGISIDLARRLDRAEAVLQENEQIKLTQKVTQDFSDLIDRHNLNDEEVQEFTNYLIENDKNPMLDSNVDIAAEYLKLHYQDMIDKAVSAALAKEESRKKKVEEQAPSSVPKGVGDKEEQKINTVKELDDLFNELDL